MLGRVNIHLFIHDLLCPRKNFKSMAKDSFGVFLPLSLVELSIGIGYSVKHWGAKMKVAHVVGTMSYLWRAHSLAREIYI